jgi:hypothetical protein
MSQIFMVEQKSKQDVAGADITAKALKELPDICTEMHSGKAHPVLNGS